MKSGGYALYLDMNIDGERVRESLGLYLQEGKGPRVRDLNNATLEAANRLLAKRTIEIQDSKVGILRKRPEKMLLRDAIMDYASTHARSKSYHDLLVYLSGQCERFRPNALLSDVDKRFVLGLKGALAKSLGENSMNRVLQYLSAILNNCVKRGLIPTNPYLLLDKSEKPRVVQAERAHLTHEELRALLSSECPDETLKEAFLFSCFTGLRISDIKALRWENIEGDSLVKRMKKTNDVVYVPLSKNALAHLPKRERRGCIFKLHSAPTISDHLEKWRQNAGVDKHITFHVARHTFATLAITYGADIYTVSNLLGHKNISTTLIYAKIVDEKKKKAVDLIPDL